MIEGERSLHSFSDDDNFLKTWAILNVPLSQKQRFVVKRLFKGQYSYEIRSYDEAEGGGSYQTGLGYRERVQFFQPQWGAFCEGLTIVDTQSAKLPGEYRSIQEIVHSFPRIVLDRDYSIWVHVSHPTGEVKMMKAIMDENYVLSKNIEEMCLCSRAYHCLRRHMQPMYYETPPFHFR